MRLGSFENIIYKMFSEIICLIYMYEKNLVLNNIQWFLCLKSKAELIL